MLNSWIFITIVFNERQQRAFLFELRLKLKVVYCSSNGLCSWIWQKWKSFCHGFPLRRELLRRVSLQQQRDRRNKMSETSILWLLTVVNFFFLFFPNRRLESVFPLASWGCSMRPLTLVKTTIKNTRKNFAPSTLPVFHSSVSVFIFIFLYLYHHFTRD